MDPIAVTQQALIDIAQAFVAGLHGSDAASFIASKYPQFAAAYAPLLADKQQVLLFAKNTAPLGTRSPGRTTFRNSSSNFAGSCCHQTPD